MCHFCTKHRGAISIFLALIMVPVFAIACLVVDGSRISMAKTTVSGAGDLAMNAALSEFDEELFDLYGIFAISEDMAELEKNVTRYFENSINNSGVLEQSDSYTRQFINSIFSSFSTTDLKFDNILSTTTDGPGSSFRLTGVEKSAVADSEVLERQIVEYMKYLGPIEIGKGLLTKVKCIGEMKQQTDAVKKEQKYDKALDKIEDASQKLYEAIKTYKNNVAGPDSRFKPGATLDDYNHDEEIQKTADNAYNNMILLTEYYVAANAKCFKTDEVKEGKAKPSDTQYSSFDAMQEALEEEYFEKLMADAEATEDEGDIDEDSLRGEAFQYSYDCVFWDAYNQIQSGRYDSLWATGESNFRMNGTREEDFKLQIDSVNAYIACRERMDIDYALLSVCLKYGRDDLPELAKVQDLHDRLKAYSDFAKNIPDKWRVHAAAFGMSSKDQLDKWYKEAESRRKELQDALDCIEKVKKEVEKADEARKEWKEKIDKLSDSDVKTSMTTNYDNSAKEFNPEAVEGIRRVLQANYDHFNRVMTLIDQTKYFGEVVYKSSDWKGYEKKIKAKKGGVELEFNAIVTAGAELIGSDAGVGYEKQDFNKTTVTPELIVITAEGDRDDLALYRYLDRLYGQKSAADAAKQAEDKKKKDQLLQTADEGKNQQMGAGNESAGAAGSSTFEIPDAVTKAIEELYEETNEVNPFGSTNTPGLTISNISEDDNDPLNDATTGGFIDGVAQLAKKLENFLETCRDVAYTEEYLTGMFSCATDAVDEDTKKTAITINNKPMSEHPNFGYEQEYLLWGDPDGQVDVAHTRASIFAIRFALNTIFAFTNSTTRVPAGEIATSILGFTGFGVPILQSIILLAWSLAESYLDMTQLMKGEPVPVFKSKQSWYLSAENIGKTLVNMVVDTAKDIAEKAVNDIFDSIESWTIDESGKIMDEAAEDLNDFVESTLTNLRSEVEETVSQALHGLADRVLSSAVGQTESPMGMTLKEIQEEVSSTISNLKKFSSGGTGGLREELIGLAVSALPQSNIAEMLKELQDEVLDNSEGKQPIDEITANVSDYIDRITSNVIESIQDKVDTYKNEWKGKLTETIKDTSAGAKDKVKEMIGEFTGSIDGHSDGADPSLNGSTTLAKGLTMTYKEYLKLFLLVELGINQASSDGTAPKPVLSRCAELIQLNVTAAKGDNSFNIAKAYTMVQATACISVKTSFMSLPLTVKDENGKEHLDIDFSRIGDDWFRVNYNSVMGY